MACYRTNFLSLLIVNTLHKGDKLKQQQQQQNIIIIINTTTTTTTIP